MTNLESQTILVTEKTCSTCRQKKPSSEFTASRASKDGLYWECRTCKNTRAREHYQIHQEKRIAKTREWREAHKGRVADTRRRYEREQRLKNRQERARKRGWKLWGEESE